MIVYGVELFINEAESCIIVIEAADAYCAEIWIRQHFHEFYKIGDIKRIGEINNDLEAISSQ